MVKADKGLARLWPGLFQLLSKMGNCPAAHRPQGGRYQLIISCFTVKAVYLLHHKMTILTTLFIKPILRPWCCHCSRCALVVKENSDATMLMWQQGVADSFHPWVPQQVNQTMNVADVPTPCSTNPV